MANPEGQQGQGQQGQGQTGQGQQGQGGQQSDRDFGRDSENRQGAAEGARGMPDDKRSFAQDQDQTRQTAGQGAETGAGREDYDPQQAKGGSGETGRQQAGGDDLERGTRRQ